MRALFLTLVLSGCCGKGEPSWLPLDTLYLGGEAATLDLTGLVLDDKGIELVTADSDADVIAEIDGMVLTVTPQPGWDGTTFVRLEAEDACGNRASTELEVDSGEPPTSTTPNGGRADCATVVTYVSSGSPDAVAIAGAFNDWSTEDDRLELVDGVWTIALDLDPGAYPYKLVEIGAGSFGDEEQWLCDPSAELIQCDKGYKEPWEIGFSQVCAPGVEACNSLLVVEACAPPALEVTDLDIDRAGASVHVEVDATPGAGGAITDAVATLDGAPLDGAWDGTRFVVDASGLDRTRHTLRFRVTDQSGNESEEVYVPFWLDDRAWEDGVMYFAFVDRLHDGDPSNNDPEGATAIGGAYEGGDLRGLIDLLPYLDDLGVSVLWLSNMQDNAEGPWAGDCGLTYSGYHAYWPDDPFAVDEHFGTDADLLELVDEAHARGMRVIMDWVANHVHEDHPYYAEHPEWFNGFESCKDYVDGQINFDRIPETCWFAPYLPDIDYSHPDALDTMVEDAMWWAKTYELDGFRVDAVKHMSHAVVWNLASAIDQQIEHVAAGGDEHFMTMGETFDSNYALINAYVGEDQLSAQFDFPLYFSIRDAFIYGGGDLQNVLHSWNTSKDAYGDAPMSTFLGNHDVLRFTSDASTGWQDICDNGNIRVAQAPTDWWPYDRLKLGWTFLFTMPGTPLVYYGDEFGMPGNPDPDNRQPLWWHAGDLGGVQSVDDLAGQLSAPQASVVQHVKALARAREAHPALRYGGWGEWWVEPDLVGYTRIHDGDFALVVLNRSDSPRDLGNGLSFAGLPEGTYEDVLTGQTFTSTGDFITVPVDGRGSRVLVWRP